MKEKTEAETWQKGGFQITCDTSYSNTGKSVIFSIHTGFEVIKGSIKVNRPSNYIYQRN